MQFTCIKITVLFLNNKMKKYYTKRRAYGSSEDKVSDI